MKEYKSFYKEVTGNEGGKCQYNKHLDTYGCGCAHDCSYCYAKSLLSFRGLWDEKNPSVASLAKIERKISKLEPGTIVRLGGMTDCFQPMERRERITKGTIELLNKYGIGYLIVTKSDLVCEYMNILNKDLAHIQISVTFVPCEKAVSTERRIKAIETLYEAGFNVKHNIVGEGVIDAGYTGSICVKLYNHGSNDYVIEAGDKISQIVVLPIVTPELELADDLGETERGTGGFGSTGR